MKNLMLHLSLLFFMTCSVAAAQTQLGLDPTFGNGNGYVVKNVGTNEPNSTLSDAIVQPDGKILACGYYGMVRFMPDGTPDNSFGVAGLITLPEGGRQVRLKSDGKIILCSSYIGMGPGQDDKKYLTRYHPNGEIDVSFGHNGHSDSVSDFGDPFKGVLVQTDDKILLISEKYNSDSLLQVVRLTGEGLIDSSFGIDGLMLQSIGIPGSYNLYRVDVALQADGKMLIAGNVGTPEQSLEWFVMRLLPDGSKDTSFNHTGVATAGGVDFPKAMALQPDGKIVIAGNNLFDNPAPFVLVRFNTDGSRDWGFGDAGICTLPWSIGEENKVSGIVVQSGGRIVVCGKVWNEADTSYKFALTAATAAGQPDITFGDNGRLISIFGSGFELCLGMTIQEEDDKLITVGGGGKTDTSDGDGLCARYLADAHSDISDISIIKKQIMVYPNPAKDIIRIANKSDYHIDNVSIQDISGRRLIFSKGDKPVTITHLSAGLYFLLVSAENGKIIAPIPFIIHH